MTFSLGSVSTDTLKTDDLLTAFANELEARAPLTAERQRLADDAWAYSRVLAHGHLTAEGQERAMEVRAALEDALNELCPPYVHFGAHTGDGADFGFWPDIERLEEDAFHDSMADPSSSTPVTKVSDLGELPERYTGLAMQVSDHGNVTLYEVQDGEATELWGCV